MKERYEDRYRFMLPRRTYTIIRLDGKAFHTFTRHCAKPYDIGLMTAFDLTALELCKKLAGCTVAYTQSDEISLLLSDFSNPDTEAWFDGNLQKICSVAASLCTAEFNRQYVNYTRDPTTFDARVFVIPDPIEVENYFIWRQKDAERNSLSMLAQHYYSHKQLHGVDAAGQHELIHRAGDNWNNHPDGFKRGRWVVYRGQRWDVHNAPIFTKEREELTAVVPRQWADSPVTGQ